MIQSIRNQANEFICTKREQKNKEKRNSSRLHQSINKSFANWVNFESTSDATNSQVSGASEEIYLKTLSTFRRLVSSFFLSHTCDNQLICLSFHWLLNDGCSRCQETLIFSPRFAYLHPVEELSEQFFISCHSKHLKWRQREVKWSVRQVAHRWQLTRVDVAKRKVNVWAGSVSHSPSRAVRASSLPREKLPSPSPHGGGRKREREKEKK